MPNFDNVFLNKKNWIKSKHDVWAPQHNFSPCRSLLLFDTVSTTFYPWKDIVGKCIFNNIIIIILFSYYSILCASYQKRMVSWPQELKYESIWSGIYFGFLNVLYLLLLHLPPLKYKCVRGCLVLPTGCLLGFISKPDRKKMWSRPTNPDSVTRFFTPGFFGNHLSPGPDNSLSNI